MEKNNKKEQRTISAIAIEIKQVWKNVYFGAVQYLNAMLRLETVNDSYGADSARDIVNYFLSNAIYWRGEDARRIKKELNELLKND